VHLYSKTNQQRSGERKGRLTLDPLAADYPALLGSVKWRFKKLFVSSF
jgi:hypothetical protein